MITQPNFGLSTGTTKQFLFFDTLYSDEFTALAKNSNLLIHEGFATESLFELSSETWNRC